jgi:ATP-dependent RNA helicase DDX55/SPB4
MKGLSVVFLNSGREEDYVTFLSIRKTPVTPLTRPAIEISPEEAAEAAQKIRDIARTDRAIHDKAQRGFVSFVRSYAAHQASSIFRVSDLDWADLGSAWGLLRLPKMPELRSWDGDRTLGQAIEWDTYSYKDKAREKARLVALDEAREDPEDKTGKARREEIIKKRKNNEAWSAKHGHEELRAERREKRRKRKESERMSKMTEEEMIKHMELNEMLAEIRKRNQAAAAGAAEDEFEGFDD